MGRLMNNTIARIDGKMNIKKMRCGIGAILDEGREGAGGHGWANRGGPQGRERPGRS
jgi:hypothetical protein